MVAKDAGAWQEDGVAGGVVEGRKERSRGRWRKGEGGPDSIQKSWMTMQTAMWKEEAKTGGDWGQQEVGWQA